MADVAYVFHFPPSELWGLEIDELMEWHRQAMRYHGKEGECDG